MTKPWHERAAEWLEQVSPDPATRGVLFGLLTEALAERDELVGLVRELADTVGLHFPAIYVDLIARAKAALGEGP